MDGVIRGAEVLKHARLIWREFGLRALVRCVRTCVVGRRTTFLDVIWERHS
jgi:hypothetical protein